MSLSSHDIDRIAERVEERESSSFIGRLLTAITGTVFFVFLLIAVAIAVALWLFEVAFWAAALVVGPLLLALVVPIVLLLARRNAARRAPRLLMLLAAVIWLGAAAFLIPRSFALYGEKIQQLKGPLDRLDSWDPTVEHLTPEQRRLRDERAAAARLAQQQRVEEAERQAQARHATATEKQLHARHAADALAYTGVWAMGRLGQLTDYAQNPAPAVLGDAARTVAAELQAGGFPEAVTAWLEKNTLIDFDKNGGVHPKFGYAQAMSGEVGTNKRWIKFHAGVALARAGRLPDYRYDSAQLAAAYLALGLD